MRIPHNRFGSSTPSNGNGFNWILPAQVLTIVRIKPPWYVWKGLIACGMRKTIPLYRRVPGLLQKFYTVGDDHRSIGGVYCWENQERADAWFDSAWHQHIKQKYGKGGQVDYFQVAYSKVFSNIRKQENKLFLILHQDPIHKYANKIPEGLLIEMYMKNRAGIAYWLTFWDSKLKAKANLGALLKQEVCFHVPLFIFNLQ